jgi:folylpolyglutamate synthase/dihydropteroate synthase
MESSDALIARFLALHPKTIDLSLGRIERLLAALASPRAPPAAGDPRRRAPTARARPSR